MLANLILTARPSRLATLKKEVVAEGTQNKSDFVMTSYKWDTLFFRLASQMKYKNVYV